jgi:predicted RNA binding protein YcfA (HicA-like mRNA interferase family)
MTRRPRVTGKKVVAALRRAGFEVIRVKGSHHSCSPAMAEGQSCLFTRVRI